MQPVGLIGCSGDQSLLLSRVDSQIVKVKQFGSYKILLPIREAFFSCTLAVLWKRGMKMHLMDLSEGLHIELGGELWRNSLVHRPHSLW